MTGPPASTGEPVVSGGSWRWLWPAAALLSIALPLGWGFLQPGPPVPPQIAALWVPGKINVVEFADFQCPYCRKLHPAMTEVLGTYGDRVHFVRLNMPLPMHPQARDAARAYCCAEEQGKSQAMADALFDAPDLSPEACAEIATRFGLSMDAYRRCVASATTEARIDQQIAQVKGTASRIALPTVWVGEQVIVGLAPLEALEGAFSAAAKGAGGAPISSLWFWVALSLSLGGLAAGALLRPDGKARSGAPGAGVPE